MARVQLESMDPDDFNLKEWLAEHNVIAVMADFSPNGNAEITFEADEQTLSDLIIEFWGDEDLISYIEP